MTGAQHKIVGIGWGIAGAYLATTTMDTGWGLLIAPMSAIGCWLPDMDHDKTKLGRKRKVLTTVSTGMANLLVYGGIAACVIFVGLVALGFADFGVDMTHLGIMLAGLVGVVFLKKVVCNSDTFKWATKHRGLMHTLVVPALLLYSIGLSESPLYKYSVMGLAVGYISHLFADMLTVEGCPILFPLSRSTINIARFKTSEYLKDAKGNKKKNRAIWYAAYGAAILPIFIVMYFKF